MKWLLLPILWLCALVVAIAILWRFYRGKNVVLRGHFGPRFVRMVVVILVAFGVGIDRQASGEEKPAPGANPTATPQAELPAAIDNARIEKWLQNESPRGPWPYFKQQMVRIEQAGYHVTAQTVNELTDALPTKFRALVTADLAAHVNDQPAPRVKAEDLLAALSEMEAAGYYDHFLSAMLFRMSAAALRDGLPPRPQAEPFVQLYARLHQHARLTNLLIKAQARVKPLMLRPRAWMSKAYNPARDKAPVFVPMSIAEMVIACRELYAASDVGTWDRDGLARFTLGAQSAALTLLRGGVQTKLAARQDLRFSRLDLIETPAGAPSVVLSSSWLGAINLPPGHVLSSWELARHLSPEARAKIHQTISEALAGSESAAAQLETHLPLVQSALREALAKQPQEKGAPRLRMILALFDDAVMPPFVPAMTQGGADSD